MRIMKRLYIMKMLAVYHGLRLYIAAKGDPIADLYEDIAAEEKARATYQWIINMSDDVDLNDSLRFLR